MTIQGPKSPLVTSICGEWQQAQLSAGCHAGFKASSISWGWQLVTIQDTKSQPRVRIQLVWEYKTERSEIIELKNERLILRKTDLILQEFLMFPLIASQNRNWYYDMCTWKQTSLYVPNHTWMSSMKCIKLREWDATKPRSSCQRSTILPNANIKIRSPRSGWKYLPLGT